jgi:hypothetical protein
MKPPLLVFVSLSILCNALAAKKCYYPNGRETDDAACGPNAEHSACCWTNTFAYACLSNGLCLTPSGRITRGSCTDRDWKSRACASYCTRQSNLLLISFLWWLAGTLTGKLDARDTGLELISCSNVTNRDNSNCCRGLPYCCDQGVGRFEAESLPIFTWATFDS